MIIIYPEKRNAIFKVDTDEYDFKNGGWIQVEEDSIIIGETDDGYITRILETSIGYWDEYGKYEAHMCLPICIHKSRFVKWCSIQMQLF